MQGTIDLEVHSPCLSYTHKELCTILGYFNRTPETIAEDVKSLMNWFNEQPHLPKFLYDRQIIMFLLFHKFSIEKTKRAIDLSFTVKTLFPEYYGDAVPIREVKKVHDALHIVTLPRLSKNLKRVTMLGLTGESNFEKNYAAGYIVMIAQLRCLLDICNGDEFVIDLSNLNTALFSMVTLADVKKIAFIAENVYANRGYAFYIINLPAYAEALFAFIKSILTPKLRNRIHFLRSPDELKKFYDDDFLPKEFGGTGPSIYEVKDNWWKLFESKIDFLEASRKAIVDESLRPEKLCNDELLGYYGNFRKLDVD